MAKRRRTRAEMAEAKRREARMQRYFIESRARCADIVGHLIAQHYPKVPS